MPIHGHELREGFFKAIQASDVWPDLWSLLSEKFKLCSCIIQWGTRTDNYTYLYRCYTDLCSRLRWPWKSSVTWLGSPPGKEAHMGQTTSWDASACRLDTCSCKTLFDVEEMSVIWHYQRYKQPPLNKLVNSLQQNPAAANPGYYYSETTFNWK